MFLYCLSVNLFTVFSAKVQLSIHECWSSYDLTVIAKSRFNQIQQFHNDVVR